MNHVLEYFGLRLDKRRLQRRFGRIERRLRARDVSSLSYDLQIQRAASLDHLHAYWRRGKFPRNHHAPRRFAPCFIDRDGTVCAVAHLVIESRHGDLAQWIANDANNATITEMTLPELDVWVAQSGLTRDELAYIQPNYPGLDEIKNIAYESFLIWLVVSLGGVTILVNLFFIAITKHASKWGLWLPLIPGTILIFIAAYRFDRIFFQLSKLQQTVFAPPLSEFVTAALTDFNFLSIAFTCGLYLILVSISLKVFNSIKARQSAKE